MLISLLAANLVVAFVMSFIVAAVFRKPISRILQRLIGDDIYEAWVKYMIFAIYIVGISGGIRVWAIEKYLNPDPEGAVLVLTQERWLLEIYQTVIGSLQSNVWMLLVFFIFALMAYVIVKGFEMKSKKIE
ncbi:MAG: hypothetical protein A2W25_01620 [candidate division Zixibacteria bacterium RBG_16_53_22]|nr:MAG: hypothetical protein A2W25_01620 [candidate division Zixibacteria bacterium RBG_16_53_22]